MTDPKAEYMQLMARMRDSAFAALTTLEQNVREGKLCNVRLAEARLALIEVYHDAAKRTLAHEDAIKAARERAARNP